MTAKAAPRLLAADSSVLIPAYLSAHEHHTAAAAVLDDDVAAPVHVLLETYATLTSMPSPLRQEPETVAQWLADEFPSVLPFPAAGEVAGLIALLSGAGLRSGAVYDGLVALSAQSAGHRLLTMDQRARTIYRLVGADVETVA